MTAALLTFAIFVLLVIGVAVALRQHERDLQRGIVTKPESTAAWWVGIIIVLVLSAYGIVTDNDAHTEAIIKAARK